MPLCELLAFVKQVTRLPILYDTVDVRDPSSPRK